MTEEAELASVLEDMREEESSAYMFVVVPMPEFTGWINRIEAALTSHGGGGEAVQVVPYGFGGGAVPRWLSKPVAPGTTLYLGPQPRGEGMVLEQLRRELAEDKGWDYTEYEKGRIAEKERCISLLAATPAVEGGPTPRDVLTYWLDEQGFPSEAQNVRAGIDLASYEEELRMIEFVRNFPHRRLASPAVEGGLPEPDAYTSFGEIRWACDVDARQRAEWTPVWMEATIRRLATAGQYEDY